MIDATVKIIDRLIQLLTIREKNREKYFNNFVQPLYNDAELIVGDYIQLFQELIARLKEEEDVPTVIKWLESRRFELLPLRIKVRSFLTNTGYEQQIRIEESMDKFQKGIWGLMKGGLSLIEEGHSQLREYGWHDHTVLDLLYAWSQQPISENRDRYIKNAEMQLSCIEKAWKDVTEGYVEIKKELM